MSKKYLKEFHVLGGVVSRRPFDSQLDTPVHGSGVKLTSLVEGEPESWNESEQTINVQRFLEDVANYGNIGQSIYRETNLKEIAIKLSEIDYSHDSIRNSISDIDLIIKKNSYVAFVGPSGSGKTTCVDIILGLLKPTNGLVMIDNDSMNDIDSETFLNRIGYVQQSPFLFNGSIKDNLLWSNPDATESGMWDALHIANIDNSCCLFSIHFLTFDK